MSAPGEKDTRPGTALELRGLSVGHGRAALVRDVCLSVRPGQVVALVGPNGSGKTTILRTVAGQLRALGGSVELFGRDLAGMPGGDRARTMAVMLTGRPSTELTTCRDVVEAGRYPYTGRLGVLGAADDEAVLAAMEATGVSALAERDFAHVSDGQRQRVLLARALCQEPRVLLLDEPTSYLDVRSQLDVLDLLRRRARERGIAVVASLHEIGLAQRAADRVVCVRDGRVLFQGTPDEVFTAPRMRELYDLGEGSFNPLFGSVELARETVSLGLYIGLGGVVTFKNARHSVEVAAEIPLDRLLTETDAPYMAPVPFRGKRCDSTMIAYDAAKIAEARGITAQEVLRAGCENARRLFRLPTND